MLPAGSKRTRLTCSSRCTLSLASRRVAGKRHHSANVRTIGSADAAHRIGGPDVAPRRTVVIAVADRRSRTSTGAPTADLFSGRRDERFARRTRARRRPAP